MTPTRRDMEEAIMRYALTLEGFGEGKELSLRLMLITSDAAWVEQQYRNLGLARESLAN